MKPEEKVVELLKKHQLKLTTIESCTAGAIAARIVDVPGASEVFEQGFVTYSNEAKMRAVKVQRRAFGSKSGYSRIGYRLCRSFRWLGSTGRNCLYRLWFCQRNTGERISSGWQSKRGKRRSSCLCSSSALRVFIPAF